MTIYRPSHHLIIPGARVSQPGGAAGNGLLNALIAYWPGNEASGNALDLHTNALHLTDANTVTSAAGLVYATARQYTAAICKYHARAADDVLFSTGDVDFTIAVWCWMDSKTASERIVSKWTTAVAGREYTCGYLFAWDRFFLQVRDMADATTTTVQANTLGSPSINAWYLIIAGHDAANNLAWICVNNGAVDTQPHAGGVFDSASRFAIGTDNVGSGANMWDGRIGPTMFWKSAAGGGGVLTAAQRTALYNAGAGLPYASFTA